MLSASTARSSIDNSISNINQARNNIRRFREQMQIENAHVEMDIDSIVDEMLGVLDGMVNHLNSERWGFS
jgi:hypothetical protein